MCLENLGALLQGGWHPLGPNHLERAPSSFSLTKDSTAGRAWADSSPAEQTSCGSLIPTVRLPFLIANDGELIIPPYQQTYVEAWASQLHLWIAVKRFD